MTTQKKNLKIGDLVEDRNYKWIGIIIDINKKDEVVIVKWLLKDDGEVYNGSVLGKYSLRGCVVWDYLSLI